MALLEEKQAYYQYGQSGWTYKQPPAIEASLQKEMERIAGCDSYGDPVYQFIWGGVAVVRDDPESTSPVIRGDRRATKINHGRLQPRWLFVRARQPKCLCYKNDKGRVVRVSREDQIPSNTLSWWEFEYVDYGELYWHVCRKLAPDQLVAAQVYHRDDPSIPKRGEYRSILKIETPDHLYFDPLPFHVEATAKYHEELETESLSDLRLKDTEGRLRARSEREQGENASRQRIVETLLAYHMGQSAEEAFQR